MFDSLHDQLNWYAGRRIQIPAGTSDVRIAGMVRRARQRHLLARARMAASGEFTFTPEDESS